MATKQASKMTKAAEKSKEKQRRGKPFKKGQSGNLSGRPRGSKNYKTLAFEERLESLGCDHLKVLATICNDEREETNLRLASANAKKGSLITPPLSKPINKTTFSPYFIDLLIFIFVFLRSDSQLV